MITKRLLLTFCVITVSLAAFSGTPRGAMSLNSSSAPSGKALTLTDEERQLVRNNSDFAFSLFRKLRSELSSSEPVQPSVVLSPLSITYALGMLNNGATGQTQQQISEVLGGAGFGSCELINGFCRKMLDASGTLDKKTQVLIANNIYVNASRGYRLQPAFVQAAADYYDATPETRDFFDGHTRDAINQWSSDHTKGMITEPLKESEFDPMTISYLLNALYFKSEWTLPFDKSQTRKTRFGENATAEMMCQAEGFMYAEDDWCQSIRLPYGNGAFEMTVFLPRHGKTIDDLLSRMNGSTWNAMNYAQYEVFLMLPRFETDTDQRLEHIMAALGMPRAFDPASAQFEGFAVNDAHPGTPIHIDFMKQVAKIRVNESGTEAAAVTVIGMKDGMAPEVKYAEFIADRPFLYVISERSSGSIFFMGQYMGEPVENARHDISLTDSERQLVQGNNTFAFRLFDKVRGNGNCIVSPLSITYALGMMNNGAAGQTRQEICDVLGFGQAGADGINQFCRKLLTEAPTLDATTSAEIANTVFVNSRSGFELQQDFVEKASQYYDASPQVRDFNDGLTMNVINQWGSDHTHGMIPQILNELTFNPGAESYLLNALYFKGQWTKKFDKADTRDEVFNGGDKAPMMSQKEEFDYAENDYYQAVRLPYGNEAFEMTVFLPRKDKTIDEVLSQLDAENWQPAYRGQYQVDLKLPRFKTESGLPLSGVMSSLGMPTAFSNAADFSSFGNRNVFIGDMFQKAVIELDEEGTVAAAITELYTVSSIPGEAVFHADRPFFYIISEQSTGIIFFMGQYVGTKTTAAVDAPRRPGTAGTDDVLFNMAGQRLAAPPSRGLYLRNGRKVINAENMYYDK